MAYADHLTGAAPALAQTHTIGRRMQNIVVARYLDGRLIKGTSLDVAPTKPECHIRTADRGMVEVSLADLKALYFVKTPEGDAQHQYATQPTPDDPRLAGSHRVTLTFKDGETLAVLANRYPPVGKFFWALPVDAASNTIRILVNRAALEAIATAG